MAVSGAVLAVAVPCALVFWYLKWHSGETGTGLWVSVASVALGVAGCIAVRAGAGRDAFRRLFLSHSAPEREFAQAREVALDKDPRTQAAAVGVALVAIGVVVAFGVRGGFTAEAWTTLAELVVMLGFVIVRIRRSRLARVDSDHRRTGKQNRTL